MAPPRRPIPSARQAQQSLGKIPPVNVEDIGAGKAPPPASDLGRGANRANIYTYFTKPPQVGDKTPILYPGDQNWARVTLTLETAGPVAVGQSSQITPVLSGKGILLATGIPLTFDIAKGSRLYIASTAVNRIKVQIQPVPWLEQITGFLNNMVGALLRR